MQDVLCYVEKIIHAGRLSGQGTGYSYLAGFTDDILVLAKRNKASDTFIIVREGETNACDTHTKPFDEPPS